VIKLKGVADDSLVGMIGGLVQGAKKPLFCKVCGIRLEKGAMIEFRNGFYCKECGKRKQMKVKR
jgi:hypothetical protein